MRRYLLLLQLLGISLMLKLNAGESIYLLSNNPHLRPWVRWWWLGNAVDELNLSWQLESLASNGFGGVEVCPIYGVRGWEDKFVPFLSSRWTYLYNYSIEQAHKLGLQIDLTTGTGWPFGGPDIPDKYSSSSMDIERYQISGPTNLTLKVSKGYVETIRIFSNTGSVLIPEFTTQEEFVRIKIPPGDWKIYIVKVNHKIQHVKRAAPGGEGYVIDPFSTNALAYYLRRFEFAVSNYSLKLPRAFFHDSYEYFGANWTPTLWERFLQMHQYDLRNKLPALIGDDEPDVVKRVRYDYRILLGQMHEEFINFWTAWAHSYGAMTRNQAHGAPSNLIDVYGAADIPETELFGRIEEGMYQFHKIASSAAHLKGNTLCSAEAFTWLGEHFQVTLDELKNAADNLFLAGINHLIYHGVPYTPKEVSWPGWQFYASVNFGPMGGLWDNLKFFNQYVTLIQSVLQRGKPSEEILVYFPIHDWWASGKEPLLMFRVHNLEDWLKRHPVYGLTEWLRQNGFGFDFISDSFLKKAVVKDQKICLGDMTWSCIIIPSVEWIPTETLAHLVSLVESGAYVLFWMQLPKDVPGMGQLEARKAIFTNLKARLQPSIENPDKWVKIGKGRVAVANQLVELLSSIGLHPEPASQNGLLWVRRKDKNGMWYFIVNPMQKFWSGWMGFSSPCEVAWALDPVHPQIHGILQTRVLNKVHEAYIEIPPHGSLIVFAGKQAWPNDEPLWPYLSTSLQEEVLSTSWKIRLIDKTDSESSEYPAIITERLLSLDELLGEGGECFHGVIEYETEINLPHDILKNASYWIIDLGELYDSARVYIDDIFIGAVWCKPFIMPVLLDIQPGQHKLKIQVSNIGANKIRDMDRRKVNWKYFYDINMVNQNYRPFDASNWPTRKSGLLGPVKLLY